VRGRPDDGMKRRVCAQAGWIAGKIFIGLSSQTAGGTRPGD
jgi:hypothetical protein